MDEPTVAAVAATIVTGLRGMGKSSAIAGLLKHKPSGERWAVLVTERGEVDVEADIASAQSAEAAGVFIEETFNRCSCCAPSVPVQTALESLLLRVKPDHLLIEANGLEDPQDLLQMLKSDYYRQTIDIQQVLTVVDARKLSDSRYTDHGVFNRQIAAADIVVGSKQDLYQGHEAAALQDYVKRISVKRISVKQNCVKQRGGAEARVVFADNGQIHTLTPLLKKAG